MKVWMKVTDDEYELPVIVADTSKELAKKCGVSAMTIRALASRVRSGERKSSTYICVEIEEKEEQ